MSISGSKTIQDLCLRFDLSESIKSSAMTKFESLSKHVSFNFTSKHTKSILSSVCLYLSLSEDHKPLAITQICSTIDCNINDFGKVYNQVIKEFSHLKNELVSIEGLVEVILKDVSFNEEERQPLIERVIQLIRIVRQCWLIEGRSPVHIIIGTSFLAWKSLNPSVRTKVKLTEFCGIVSIDYKHTTSKRVNEIFNALKKLGQKIPGKEKFQFTRQNIAIFIDDILNYSNSLLFDLSFDVNKQFKLMSNNTEEATINWINTFKQRSRSDIEGHQNVTQTSGETSIPKDNQTEEDISDSEINCYIRSETEVKKIKKLKKFIQNQEKEEQIEEKREEKRKRKEKVNKMDKIEGYIDFKI